jgi:hypothetical protein
VEENDRRAGFGSGLDDVETDARRRNEPLPKAFRERVQRVLRGRSFDPVSLIPARSLRYDAAQTAEPNDS